MWARTHSLPSARSSTETTHGGHWAPSSNYSGYLETNGGVLTNLSIQEQPVPWHWAMKEGRRHTPTWAQTSIPAVTPAVAQVARRQELKARRRQVRERETMSFLLTESEGPAPLKFETALGYSVQRETGHHDGSEPPRYLGRGNLPTAI